MSTNTTSASPHWFGLSLDTFLVDLRDNCRILEPYPNVSDPDISAKNVQECISATPSLSEWFDTLQDGIDGQPFSELLGEKNQDKLFEASSRLYARYAIQSINANMRAKGGWPSQDVPRYNAIILIPVVRPAQNKGPKVILQVFLGLMVLCGAISCLMVDTKEVLRKSPSSIAGKMALLARSRLCIS
jgi:hypothetical protein